MESLVMSFVTALTDAESSDGNPGKVLIVVPRPRAYLADLLAKAFEAREDVEIITDRRYGDRRTRQLPFPVERRRGERRRLRQQVIEVVIGGSGQPGGPRHGTA